MESCDALVGVCQSNIIVVWNLTTIRKFFPTKSKNLMLFLNDLFVKFVKWVGSLQWILTNDHQHKIFYNKNSEVRLRVFIFVKFARTRNSKFSKTKAPLENAKEQHFSQTSYVDNLLHDKLLNTRQLNLKWIELPNFTVTV